ncbi:hypothetical protein SY27_12470 [Flavobacterium sp. 316]|nr:hypothetical protein SY27_12470 [Flavobacterium sp. 316]
MLIFIKIIVSLLVLLAVLILFLNQDDLGYDELSKYKKLKDRIGIICYLVIIIGFICLFFIDKVLK